jgi:hypothetical protein
MPVQSRRKQQREGSRRTVCEIVTSYERKHAGCLGVIARAIRSLLRWETVPSHPLAFVGLNLSGPAIGSDTTESRGASKAARCSLTLPAGGDGSSSPLFRKGGGRWDETRLFGVPIPLQYQVLAALIRGGGSFVSGAPRAFVFIDPLR